MTTPDRRYQFPPPPSKATFDRETADKIFGSIADRIDALEAKRTELQDLIDDLSFNGQARLDAAIVPLIAQTQAQIDDLNLQVAATVAANADVIDNFQADTAAALAALNAQITNVENRVDTILAGGIPAADVEEDADRVFVTPNQRTEIETLRGEADAITEKLNKYSKPVAGDVGKVNVVDASGNFVLTLLQNGIKRSTRSSNFQIAKADQGKFIDITSGSFTQTFAAASALESGWFCYLRNGGTGNIPLDPNGSETIDGLTSYVMYPGEVRKIFCDGASLRSIVLNSFYAKFETSANFVPPPGYKLYRGLLWGGGSGGARGATSSTGGGGGGAGACTPIEVRPSQVNNPENVIIGAGGQGGNSYPGAGGTGGQSSFAGFYAYNGGAGICAGTYNQGQNGGGGGGVLGEGESRTGPYVPGGSPAAITSNGTPHSGFGGGAGGQGGGSDAFYGGGGGGGGEDSGTQPGNNGGKSVYGGGGGAGGSVSTTNPTGQGGASRFGGAGGDGGGPSTQPTSGQAPGGGGGGGYINQNGRPGARGELQIWGVF